MGFNSSFPEQSIYACTLHEIQLHIPNIFMTLFFLLHVAVFDLNIGIYIQPLYLSNFFLLKQLNYTYLHTYKLVGIHTRCRIFLLKLLVGGKILTASSQLHVLLILFRLFGELLHWLLAVYVILI